jgi:hypothetical protein
MYGVGIAPKCEDVCFSVVVLGQARRMYVGVLAVMAFNSGIERRLAEMYTQPMLGHIEQRCCKVPRFSNMCCGVSTMRNVLKRHTGSNHQHVVCVSPDTLR